MSLRYLLSSLQWLILVISTNILHLLVPSSCSQKEADVGFSPTHVLFCFCFIFHTLLTVIFLWIELFLQHVQCFLFILIKFENWFNLIHKIGSCEHHVCFCFCQNCIIAVKRCSVPFVNQWTAHNNDIKFDNKRRHVVFWDWLSQSIKYQVT